MEVPVSLVGQAYQHRSLSLSNQTLKNWWPELNPEVENAYSLMPWPGYSEFSAISGTNPGGMHKFQGGLFKVTDTTLYSVNSSGTETSIGTIAGTSMCSFDSSNSEMVIVRDGNVYTYDGTTLSSSLDADQDNPDFVTHNNNQCIYDGDDGLFRVSDVDDFTTINALNVGNPLKSSGYLVRPYAFNDIVYMMKADTTEPWYNSKVGSPPYDPYQGQFISSGTVSGHSVAHNENFMYYLGNDNRVYRLQGIQTQVISTTPITNQIKSYTNKSTAIGICMTLENQNFYILKFPSEATWAYNESSGGWFELTTGNSQSVYDISSYANIYGKHLVEVGSNIYQLDFDLFENDGDTIIRERVSYPLTGGALGSQYKGRKITVNTLEINANIEPALSGQGYTPTLKVAYSNSDGRSWTERDLTATNAGANTWKYITNQLGQGDSFLFRLRVSDPVFASIESATADIELSIG